MMRYGVAVPLHIPRQCVRDQIPFLQAGLERNGVIRLSAGDSTIMSAPARFDHDAARFRKLPGPREHHMADQKIWN